MRSGYCLLFRKLLECSCQRLITWKRRYFVTNKVSIHLTSSVWLGTHSLIQWSQAQLSLCRMCLLFYTFIFSWPVEFLWNQYIYFLRFIPEMIGKYLSCLWKKMLWRHTHTSWLTVTFMHTIFSDVFKIRGLIRFIIEGLFSSS